MKEGNRAHTSHFCLHKCFPDRNMDILKTQSNGTAAQANSVGDRKEKSRNCLASNQMDLKKNKNNTY